MTDRSAGFSAPPQRLVEDGRQHLGKWNAPPGRANLLDAGYRGLPRPLRWWRLKEWQAFQIATPRWFVNLALFDVKLMALLQVKIYDHTRGEKLVHERKLRPGAFRVADQLADSSTRYADGRGLMAFTNRLADGRIEIDLALAATKTCPRLEAHLVIDADRGASQVVSLPLPGGVGMYAHKALFPIEGELAIGDATHRIAADEAVVIMDDHKGYYPYVMQWDWVTSATRDADGRMVGFNLTRNQCREPEVNHENCAWQGDRLGALPAVTFARERPRAPGEVWRIRDRDGRVDVTFEPTVPGDVRVNALVVESRYRGPFGRFRGRLEPDGLPAMSIDGWFGMGEEFWLRC